MASNIHKDLDNNQIHNPKDFSIAPANSRLTKNVSGALEWKNDVGVDKIIAGTNITISPTEGTGEVTINSTASGEECGIYKNYDYGRFSSDFAFGKVGGSYISNALALTNCSGALNTRLDINIDLYMMSMTNTNIGSMWMSAVTDAGQKIICNAGEFAWFNDRECGRCLEDFCSPSNDGVCMVKALYSTTIDLSGPTTSIQFMFGSACEEYRVLSDYSSIKVKEYCIAHPAQDLYKEKSEPKK